MVFLVQTGINGTPLSSITKLDVALHANGAGSITTTIGAALQFVAGSTEHRGRTKVNLTGFTQCRMITNLRSTAGAAGTKVILSYATTDSVTASDYVTVGTSSVESTITVANSIFDTGWINLTSAAKADIYLAAMASGGDGATGVTIGSIHAQFR